VVSQYFAKAFGEAVRRQRTVKNLSQEKLAERADLSLKMVSLVERAERNASLKVADSIAQGLSIPLWRLVKEAEELRPRTKQKK
jgi:transcriptional regulator with XRE-family HTH domain